jgi:hypothetical protein
MGKTRNIVLCSVMVVLLLGLVSSVNIFGLNTASDNESRPPHTGILMPTTTPDKKLEASNILNPNTLQSVWQMISKINSNRAFIDLQRLTGEAQICLSNGCYTIINRLTGSLGLDWAQSYLINELKNSGYTVEINNWTSSKYTDQNIIARKTGKIFPEEEVYFVSHIDGIAKGTAVTPAADDNASSVVNGLELARIFSNYEFERTMVLFFSSGEEQGYLGVEAYLEQLTDEELNKIKYVVNRDMTGYDGNGDKVMELFHGTILPP